MWVRRFIVFLCSLVLYLICLDRGASLWDCPEYILTAWKLEIGHPPGNPTWQLIANVTAHLGGSAEHAAVIINALSAVSMALAATFLSGIIFILLRASIFRKGTSNFPVNLCSAFGALCFSWCDSAIFSAVEAEVYALSAMFTALMLLLALKWALRIREGDLAGARRLIILNAYLAGLGIGVHELNFLIIPALLAVYIWGWRRYKDAPDRTPHSLKRGRLQTFLCCILVFLIGTSTYLIIPIRAAANPPVNTGNPSTWTAFREYYTRVQYGSTPFFYGQTPRSKEFGNADSLNMWFPRMTSTDPDDLEFYQAWSGMDPDALRPSYGDQLSFLFQYQIGYMYMRYLLWNFSGRQNNETALGGPLYGNFITGFPAIDNAMLGPQEDLPPELHEDNPGYNRYFMIPLLVGLIGIITLLCNGRAGRRVCAVVALFFLFTGVLIVVYLNQGPGQARDRDYAFLGSYMAYSIWIACGMAGFVKLAWSRFPASPRKKMPMRVLACLLCMAVPLQILSQTYDDHNRSHAPGARETAEEILADVDPGGIIIAQGDNVIFPLWYAQEVLELRPDVTVIARPYLNAEWYRLQHPDIPPEYARRLPLSNTPDSLYPLYYVKTGQSLVRLDTCTVAPD